MKKIISTILIMVICCAFMFSCENNGNYEETDKLYLVEQTMTDRTGTITVKHYYNEKYQIVKQDNITGGEDETESELRYDENGYWVYQKSVSKSGLVSEVVITNDENGRIIKQTFSSIYNGKKTEFTLDFEYTDENGSCIQNNSNGTVTTVTMDSYGNEIARFNNKGQSSTMKNTYDENLLIESETTMTVGTKTTVTTMKYEYDNQGNKIKETNYDSEGNVIYTQTFKYSDKVEFLD